METIDHNFEEFFQALASLPAGTRPHAWQVALHQHPICSSHLIRIPTGFGKTFGVLATWLWHRALRSDEGWPRRLVWCLPMRVLVDQTEAEVRAALARINRLWNGEGDHDGQVGVHVLMGGTEPGEWHLYPERLAVLIGTQDMLLSRAMNRGYGSPRARWPMEFGLLNQDCLWVMDEVQLMDVGLATSTQLQAFRRDDAEEGKAQRPCHTWWMSATLQPDWLAKSPDTTALVHDLADTKIPKHDRVGHLWSDVAKPHKLLPIKDAKTLAKQVLAWHDEAGNCAAGPTLVVVNTVERATELFDALRTDKQRRSDSDLRLVHSRFRGAEKARWRSEFLNRNACAPGTNRIIVATQVIEAGVDVSAALLITELAPWANLVQRFGRCARWGGTARVVVADFEYTTDKASAPYRLDALNAAREALRALEDVAPLHLERFEDDHPEWLDALYPYEPRHLLLRHELDELFDTTPDLSGGDIDISRFIRSGEERDLQVFWADVPTQHEPLIEQQPGRDALCTVPFLKARDWLCGKESATTKAPRLKPNMRAWIWDWLAGDWRRAERRDLYPGQMVLIAAECGGYDPSRGWNPDHHGLVRGLEVETVLKGSRQCWKLENGTQSLAQKNVARLSPGDRADAAQDSEALSATTRWQTIATHGKATGTLARQIAQILAPTYTDLFGLAGRWHDAGKAHEAFQVSIRLDGHRPFRDDLAKAPDVAWPCSLKRMYAIGRNDRRGGFRHELASVLALFAVLQRHAPDHPALLGPWRTLLEKAGFARPIADESPPKPLEPTPLEQEIINLDAPSFDLLTYLVCAHHGKLRLAWHASPADQESSDNVLRIRGIREGDCLPPLLLTTADGTPCELPTSRLDLAPAAAGLNPSTGRGWTERVLSLLGTHGPFTLAWLEALLRAADQRASRDMTLSDPILEADHVKESQS
ncbi:MAG: DEAD/DEAH box helicase [Thiotrichales bacterium]